MDDTETQRLIAAVERSNEYLRLIHHTTMGMSIMMLLVLGGSFVFVIV